MSFWGFCADNVKAILLAAILVPVIGAKVGYQLLTVDSLTAEVTDKERVCESSGESGQSCRWIVMTDQMSFQNADAWFQGKFSSTDLQGAIEEGKTYRFTYYGWRIPIFSVYPNLLKADETAGVRHD